MTRKLVLLGVVGMLLAGAAFAGPVTASSYSMINGFYNLVGDTTYVFEDDIYSNCIASNCGNPNLATGLWAPLSGGLGKLTDGAASTLSYNQQPIVANVSDTTYVGWFPNGDAAHGLNPTVTFQFASSDTVRTVGIHVDNTNGADGVDLPASVTIDGTNFLIAADSLNLGPRWIYFTVSDPVGSGTPLTVQFNERIIGGIAGDTSCCAVMVDEVSFDNSSSVPEPASWSMFAGGLAALVAFVRMRKG